MLKSIFSFSLLYWISHFFLIYLQISSNSSNVVFSTIILENLRTSLWIMRNQNSEIIETNNWTRLLIFDENINSYFLNMFLFMTSVVYRRTFLPFMSTLFNNLKKLILKTYPPPQSRSFERRSYAQTQDLQIFKKFNMSQMIPKEVFHKTAYSVQLPYVAGNSLSGVSYL